MAETGPSRRDGALAGALRQAVRRAAGVFAFYVHDLATGRGAAIRADESFPAASVIKLPILLRALEMVGEGTARPNQMLRLTPWHRTGGSGIFQHFRDGLRVTLEDACTAMIVLSDNTATNMVLDVTGIEPVNALLDRLGCPRTRLHRYFGKPEMPGPPGPSQAVPHEVGRVLELLARRALLTPALCETAVRMLRRQHHRALIPRLLPEGTPAAHKTGSLDGVRHDVGIIWRPQDGQEPTDERAGDVMALESEGYPGGYPIVFVGMSRDVTDLRWTVENAAERAIARAALAAYEHLRTED